MKEQSAEVKRTEYDSTCVYFYSSVLVRRDDLKHWKEIHCNFIIIYLFYLSFYKNIFVYNLRNSSKSFLYIFTNVMTDLEYIYLYYLAGII